ncbi:MAG: glycerol-3-phosphate responsive antiterminator [Clostridiaceae bacterium]
MVKLEELLIENPVIAAIRCDADLERVINSNILIVFVLYGSIMDIKQICEKLKNASKKVFVHVDLIEGLKADSSGLAFIKQCDKPDGIITTKPTIIKQAKQLGFLTIQRIFIVDSHSLQTGIKNIRAVLPDAVEVMPGVASKIIRNLEKEIHIPIIAGGLIENKKDIIESISAGAMAISTTKEVLWNE